MVLWKRSQHSRKNKNAWVKGLVVLGLVAGMTLGSQLIPTVQAAYLTPLEIPICSVRIQR